MNTLASFLYTGTDQVEEMISKSRKSKSSDNTGDLYENATCALLTLKLAKSPYNLRLQITGPFKDPDDVTIRKAKQKTVKYIQIKSAEYFAGNGINKKGNKSNKKRNCWNFTFRKDAAVSYKKDNIEFIIFCTLYESNTSYSGIEPTQTTPLLFCWIVPIDDVLKYWDSETAGTDYTISIYDTQFEHKYFQNIQLLVDACDG